MTFLFGVLKFMRLSKSFLVCFSEFIFSVQSSQDSLLFKMDFQNIKNSTDAKHKE